MFTKPPPYEKLNDASVQVPDNYLQPQPVSYLQPQVSYGQSPSYQSLITPPSAPQSNESFDCTLWW